MRHAVHLAILLVLTGTPSGAQQSRSPAMALSGSVLAWLEQCQTSGRLGGVEIEYWTGGGQPPPHLRSDQLRLFSAPELDVLEFAHPIWRKGYESHLIEKFQRPATARDVRDVARLLLETGVFSESFAEEERPGGFDMLSTEIIVSRTGQASKRTYYRTVPEQVQPLTLLVERLIAQLKAEGQRTVLYQGKPVVIDDVP